jgi:hypothetical protein
MTDNNSSSNFQKFFSDNFIHAAGDVHLSQYKDPNDDISNNSKDSLDLTRERDISLLINSDDPEKIQDFSNPINKHVLTQLFKPTEPFNTSKEKNIAHPPTSIQPNLHQGQTHPNNNSRDSYNPTEPSADLHKLITDQIKTTLTHTKSREGDTQDPFTVFLTANNNPIQNNNKKVLFSQKRTSFPILKKFQAHTPFQPSINGIPTIEKYADVSTSTSITEKTPTDLNNGYNEKYDTHPSLTTDPKSTDRLVESNLSPTPEEENNINADKEVQLDTISHTTPIQLPKLSKQIINPYAKNSNQTSDINLHTPINTQGFKIVTPLTTHAHENNFVSRTPNFHNPMNYKPNTNHNGNPTTNITPHNGTNDSNDNSLWKETNINNKNEEIKKCILSLKIQAHSDSNRSINLTPDLEPLRKVIMSQHTALENHIKDLGATCLKFTTMIEQKKESASKLTTDKRIPRSLRIKCELTTSPSYEDNPDYIILKRELQEAVNTFINTGLTVMKKWSRINIKLLTQDRCHNMLLKALNILEGIYTYWENIMEPINWPQNIQEYPILFLTKLYFNTDINSDVNNVIDYLELSPSDILLIIAKIITRNKNNNFNTNRINSIDLTELQNLTENQLTVVRETLTTLYEILKATTITLWGTSISKIRHSEASQKLKAKLEADRIASATIATSMAIDKAIANIEENTSTNNVTQLRIANLEKQLLQH